MQRKILFSLAQYIIFQSYYEFGDTLIGPNVIEVTEGEFANVVCIVRASNSPTDLREDVKCTGTLISRDHIFSSEHCFLNVGTEGLYVLIGSIDLRQANRFYMAWWITYNQWASVEQFPIQYYHNDVAVIKLIERAPQGINPAVISQQENCNLFGLDVTIVGWGQLSDGRCPYILHKVQSRIISNEDCEALAFRILGQPIVINERYLCTIADPWALLNYGDSGGPIFCGWFLVGINQGICPITNDNQDIRKANLHCSVDYYRDFIEFLLHL